MLELRLRLRLVMEKIKRLKEELGLEPGFRATEAGTRDGDVLELLL